MQKQSYLFHTVSMYFIFFTNMAFAQNENSSEYSISGFGTIAGGRSVGACQPTGLAQETDGCNRFVADWGHNGIYTQKFSFMPESRIGLQLDAKLTPDLTATVQMMSRPLANQHVTLEWAYLNYKITPRLKLQIGRQRLPMFYYSNVQNIGYAQNTIGLSTSIYGWEVTNYNGLSAIYDFSYTNWALRSEFYTGTEYEKKNIYFKSVYENNQAVTWSNILGVNLDFSQDWLSGRVSYLQTTNSRVDEATGPALSLTNEYSTKRSFYGAALNADIKNWIITSEAGTAKMLGSGVRAQFYYVSVAYRFNKWIPAIGYSTYHESTPMPDAVVTTHIRQANAVLRYDFAKNMDAKIQWTRFIDGGRQPFQGTANLVNVAMDFVF